MKTENKLTELETKALNYLRNDGWSNWGGEPYYSDVDASDVCYATGISKTSIGGVLGSLSKKGLIHVDEDNYDIIYATVSTYRHFGECNDEMEADAARWEAICAE
jgi:predicted transcriptional regulator